MAERTEGTDEELDRRWQDQLQELRVMQTGAQLTSGFLLTLPFQTTFGDLDGVQRGLYLALVLLAGLTITLVMTPVAVHRRLTGEGAKERVVRTAHLAVVAALTSVSALVVGMAVLIFDVVVNRGSALAVGAGLIVLLGSLLVALPHRLSSRG